MMLLATVVSIGVPQEGAIAAPCANTSGNNQVVSSCELVAGTYNYTGTLTLNNVTFTGSGAHIVNTTGNITITGTNIVLAAAVGGTGAGSGTTGGGYGGNGGGGAVGGAGGAYGASLINPTEDGSQGGNATTFGGGSLKILTTTGSININGSVTANGAAGSASGIGGGSGGSIWFDAPTITYTSGTVSANGGAGTGSGNGGAGGRIAAIATANNPTVTSFQARGGAGTVIGGAGVVVRKGSSITNPEVNVDNGSQNGTITPQVTSTSETVTALNISNGAKYVIPNGYTTTMSANTFTSTGSGAITPTLTIDSGGTLHSSNTSQNSNGTLAITNNGTISGITGTFHIGGSLIQAGTMSVGTLNVPTGGTATLSAATTMTTGTSVSGGSLSVTADSTLTAVNMSGGGFGTSSGATVTITSFTQSAGTATIAAGTTLSGGAGTISSSAVFNLNGTWSSAGTLAVSGGTFTMGSGSSLTKNTAITVTGGTFNFNNGTINTPTINVGTSGGTFNQGAALTSVTAINVSAGGTFNRNNAISGLATITVGGASANFHDNYGATAGLSTSGNVTINASGTYTQYGTNVTTIGGDLTVAGTLTHATNNTARTNVVNMTATNITVSGTVNVTTKGYTQNGPGEANVGWGSSHGGSGGNHPTYGSVKQPIDLGSNHDSTSLQGGGAVKLTASGNFTFSGTGNINASGSTSAVTSNGGSAGGSIWLTANAFTGTAAANAIIANGGNGITSSGNNSFGGGGGRISLNYVSNTSNLLSSDLVHAYGGAGFGTGNINGGPGSIFFDDTDDSMSNGSLLIDNDARTTSNNYLQVAESQTYDQVFLKNNANYRLPTSGTLIINSALTNAALSPISASAAVVSFTNAGGTLTLNNATITGTGTGGMTLTQLGGTWNGSGTLGLNSVTYPVAFTGFTGLSFTGISYTQSTAFTTITDISVNAGATYTRNNTITGLANLTVTGASANWNDTYTAAGITMTGNMTVGAGATFTQTGLDQLNIGGTLAVAGTLTHVANTTSKTSILDIVAGSVTTSGSGVITASEKGYPNVQPSTLPQSVGRGGSSGSCCGGGGGYGGVGGNGLPSNNAGGQTYGSSTAPDDLGGSGGNNSGNAGGAGGGQIKIQATTAVTLSGTGGIVANGQRFPSGTGGGGGAGGSIYIYIPTGTLTIGSGTFVTANGNGGSGNNANAGCGAGGRIALVTLSSSIVGTLTANKGTTCNGGNNGTVVQDSANPLPSTTAISPTSFTAGATGSANNLTVTGSDFISGSIVRFNGSDRTTTFDNSGQVRAHITTADLASASTATITVFNPAPGGGTSNGQTLTINNAPPVLSSLGTSSADVGASDQTFNITGTGFVSSVVGKWQGSTNLSTTFNSATSIQVTVPAALLTAAGTFTITAVNPSPTTGPSNGLTFTVNNLTPTTTSISPNTGTAGSGFTVTVNGTNFVSTSIVRIDGNSLSTSFVSATQLTASVLAGDIAAAGVYAITVFNPTPGGGTSNSQDLTISNPSPTTTSISPTSTTLNTGLTLTVNGTGFLAVSQVKINGVTSTNSPTIVNSTQLTVVVTAAEVNSASPRSITVFNPTPGGGTSNAQTLTVNNPVPTTTSISPTSKTVGDATFTLTVNGTNFLTSSVISLGASDLATTYVSATQLTASVDGATFLSAAATHNVTVFNPTPGGGTSNAQTFTVNNPVPAVVSTSPSTVSLGAGDTTVTVTGSNFVSGSIVQVGGSNRSTTFNSSTQVTFTMLASDFSTTGNREVKVFNSTPGGGLSNGVNITVVDPSPTISSISPTSFLAGTTETANNLTVNGTTYAANSVVRVNGSDRTTVYVSGTQLTATVTTADMAAAGTRSITVYNPTSNTSSSAATLTINNVAGTTTSISPTSRTAGSSSFVMTVNGTGFVNGATVRVNGSNRSTSFVSSTQLTATITSADQLNGGTFSITVLNPSPVVGESNAQTFTVNNPVPTTTSLSHYTRTKGSGTFTLTVYGTGFTPSAVVSVDNADIVTGFVSATELQATFPGSAQTTVGTRSITVTNPAPGGGTSNAQSLSVIYPQASTSSISPTSIQVGSSGATITVNGSQFESGAVARWNGSDRDTTFVNSTQLQVFIETADFATAGTHTITVNNPTPNAGVSNGQTFTVTNPAPTTSGITPTTKLLYDDTFTLAVYGDQFVPGSIVRFNGSNRPTTYVNFQELSAEISSSDVSTGGTHSITVFNPTPGGGTSNAQTLTVDNAVPVIDTLDPGYRTEDTGAFTLNVYGDDFAPTAAVRWNGSNRTTTFVSNTWLQANILATDINTPGDYPVTVFNPTPGGGTSDAATFTVTDVNGTTCPLSGSNVTISSSCRFAAGTYNFTGTLTIGSSAVVTLATSTLGSGVNLGSANVTVNSGSSISVEGTGGATIGGTLTVSSGASLTHGNNSSALAHHLEITANSINIAAGATVNVTGLGYDMANGPASGNSNTSGGGHGGQGGGNNDSTYGSTTQPETLGSGGRVGTGAHGGGAVHLVATGTMTINGDIYADGVDWPGISGSTGAGGSIWLSAGTLAGSGNISARGGNNTINSNAGSAGGGGRIAVYYTNDASTLISGNKIAAFGGHSTFTGDSRSGGNGTVYLKRAADTHGSLLIWNQVPTVYANVNASNAAQINDSLTLKDMIFRGYGAVQQKTGTISVSGNVVVTGSFGEVSRYNLVSGTFDASGADSMGQDAPMTLTNTGTFVLPSSATFNEFDIISTAGVITGTGASIGLINSDLNIGSTFPNLASLDVGTGSTVTYNDYTERSITALTVGSGGTITHSQTAYPAANAIFLQVGTLNVVSGGMIDANGKGYTYASCGSNTGCGHNTSINGAGGGAHYGAGGAGTGSGGAGGTAYDTDVELGNLPGSPGGRNASIASGIGGGVILLTVSTSITVNGSVTANGTTGTNVSGGGGGGTVNISASNATLGGSGTITANGGSPTASGGGCGGGGRIRIAYDVNTFSGTRAANGGSTNCAGAQLGAAGHQYIISNLALSSLSPTSKQVNSAGFTLTVNGVDFAPDAVVKWNGSARATNFVSSTQLTATINATDLQTAGSFPVTVTNVAANDTTNAINFSVTAYATPTVSSVTPNSKNVGDSGFSMTVNGTGFVNGASVVRLGGSNRSTTFVSSTQLIASILSADLLTAGTYSITVFTSTPGGGTSGSQSLVVNNPAPTTTSISPTTRTTGSSAFTLVVNGTNFVSGSVVKLDGSNRTTTFVNSTQLTAAITAADQLSAGTKSITVTNAAPGGGTSNAQTLTVGNPEPAITSISPTNAMAGGANFTLTVNGHGFNSATVIKFDGNSKTTTLVSANQVTATITSGDIAAAGSYDVTIFNPTPGGGTSNAFTFTVNGNAVTGHSPASPLTIDVITLTSHVEHASGIETVELYLDGEDPGDLVHTCTPVGSPDEADCDFEVGTLAYGPHTVYVKAYTVDDNLIEAEENFHVSTYTTTNRVTLSKLRTSAVATVTAEYELGATLSGIVTVTFPEGFSILGAPTAQASSPCFSNFGYDEENRTLYATKTNCSGHVVLGGATVQNPAIAGIYYVTWVNDDPGGGPVYISTEEEINVTGNVDPYISFRVTATSDACDNGVDGLHDDTSPAGNGGTVAFGTLSPTAVGSSDAGGVNHVCTFVSTNAPGGYVMGARSENGQLLSPSLGTGIPYVAQTGAATTETFTPGSSRYGMCLVSSGGVGKDVSLPVGYDLAATPPYDSSCSGVTTPEDGGTLTTEYNVIGSGPGEVQDGWARWLMKMSISAVDAAAEDYEDTVTFTVTATY